MHAGPLMPDNTPKPTVVVVVEDEILLRLLAVDTLTDAGFAVVEARHAAEALAHLEAEAETVDVLFTDIQMPGEMDGLELAHHAFRHWPWIALMITSGGATAAAAAFPAGSRFFAKPYILEHIVAHIQTLTALG
jgi:CheY-like chemotaxis protein